MYRFEETSANPLKFFGDGIGSISTAINDNQKKGKEDLISHSINYQTKEYIEKGVSKAIEN